MSDSTPPTDPNLTDPTSPAPKKKRRRKWPWVILALLVIVVLLVLLAPAILSTGMGRGIVVSQINKQINGRVEITDWSIGWTSGVKVDGIRVFDETNAQIAELKTFSTQLSLLDAAKGKIHLGKTAIDGGSIDAKFDKDGQLNFAKLAKSDPSAPKEKKPSDAKPADGGGKPMEIDGDVAITNVRATIEQPGQPTVYVTNFNAAAVIKSVNDPIDHSVDIALRVGDQDAGKIALKGTSSMKDGKVENLNVNDQLKLEGVNLAALRPLIPASAGVITETGLTSGEINVTVVDGKTATVSGKINGTGYAISGNALKGDRFTTTNLDLVIPGLVVAMPNGPSDSAAMAIKTGQGAVAPITFAWEQGSVKITADAPLSAVMNLAANKPPGASGKLGVDVDINVAAMAKMMPNTLSVPPDVDLKTGRLTENVDVTISSDQTAFLLITEAKDIAGTRAGKPVNIQPIKVSLKGNARGSDQKLPDLRDLVLDLTTGSGFAKAHFEAKTLTQLKGDASVDLKKMQDELGQIIAFFEGKTFAGTFAMNANATGDPQKLSTPTPAHIDVTLSGVKVTGLHEQPINLEKLVANVDSTLYATDAGAIQSLDKTKITVQNFKGTQATLDAEIKDIAVKLGDTMTATWNVSKLAANMDKLQEDLKPFVKQLQTGKLNVGTINVTLTGDMTKTGDTMTTNIKGLSVTESGQLFSVTQPDGSPLTVKMVTPKEGSPAMDASVALAVQADLNRLQDVAKPFVPALQDAKRLDVAMLDVKLNADVSQTGEALSANIKGVSIAESNKLFSLDQPGGAPLTFKMTTPKQGKGTMEASGKLGIHADLPKAQALAKQFQKQPATKEKQPSVQSGKLDGTIDLATIDAKSLKLGLDAAIDQLSVDTGNGETARQKITLKLDSIAATDFSSVRDTSFTLGGPFGDVKLTGVNVDLPAAPENAAGPALPVVKNANLQVHITDMGPIDSLRTAFAPPPPPSADPKVPTTQPVRIPRGAMTIVADVKQTGNDILVNVTELSGTEELRLQQGDGIYKVKPFNGKLSIKVATAGKPGQPIDQQITQIAVTQMDLKMGVADITMPKPITIDRPLSDNPAPNGSIMIAGKLQNLTEIPEALAKKKKGELYPYEGDFVVTQNFAMKGNTINTDGPIAVTNFVVYQDGKPFVTEPKVTIANNLSADLTAKKLTITQLIVDMPQSGALKVSVTGGITDWETKRQFDNLVVKYGGNWEKLWTIVKPMVPKDSQESIKDLTIAGTFDRQINVSGYMPATAAGAEALKTVVADGSVGIQKVTWPSNGLAEATDIEIPFVLKGGVVQTIIPNQPPEKSSPAPMKVNGGLVSIGNLTIDLNDKVAPRLTAPKDYKLVQNVNITPALADRFGKIINNPLFVNSKEAAGILSVTLAECTNLPLSEIVTKAVPENTGSASVVYSVQNLVIGNDLTNTLLSVLNREEFGSQMRGSITDGTASISRGVVVQRTPVLLGEKKKPLTLEGKAYLDTKVLEAFSMSLSTQLLNLQGKKDIAKYLPEGVVVAVHGTVDNLKFDFKTVFDKMFVEAGKKALADQLLGGGKKKDDPTAKPDDKKKDDPIGGALDDLLGGKKKKDDKKKK